MAAPIISALNVQFPAGSFFATKTGPASATSRAVNAQTVTLDACTSGTETKRVYWKQGVIGSAFVNINTLSFVGRTALSGVSATLVGGAAVSPANVQVHVRGKVYTQQVVADPLQLADVTYSYKRERYDLLEVDAVGVVHVVKGVEHDFCAGEEKPAATPGRTGLFWAYVWADTVELIPYQPPAVIHPARSVLRARFDRHRARNMAIMAPVLAKLQASEPVALQFYGDSITAQGGGWAATGGNDDTTYLQSAPNGRARDALAYLNHRTAQLDAIWGPYPTGWLDANDNGTTEHHTRGWACTLAQQLRDDYGSTVAYKNWGIGGTSAGAGVTASGAPNGAQADRLAAVAADTGDLITVNFGMNDFVGFATGGLRAPLRAIVAALQAAQPGRVVALMGAPGIGTENPNLLTWWQRHHEVYWSVAREMGCAYIPMDLIYHGGPAFTGLSRQHYSCTNRYNHPTPGELAQMRRFVAASLGLWS
jgi:lysophospholipase L1-like esterase